MKTHYKIALGLAVLFATVACRTHTQVSVQKPIIQLQIAVVQATPTPPVSIDNQETISRVLDLRESPYTKENPLLHNGYEVTLDERNDVKIKRDGTTLLTFAQPYYNDDYYPHPPGQFNLYALLKGNEKQLIIEQNTAGGVCCVEYWVVDLSGSQPRVILNTHPYPAGDLLRLHDFDQDGTLELSQEVQSLRYLNGMSGSGSPHPSAIFKYDPVARKYVVANRLFPEQVFMLMGADEMERELPSICDDENDPEKSYRCNIEGQFLVAAYIYSGQEEKGWKIFDRYVASNMYREGIKERLRDCELYKVIYNR